MNPPKRKRYLPTLDSLGSLREDGSRRIIHPAEVTGKWTRLRRAVFAVLIAVMVALPWVRIRGTPAVLLDIPGRRFYLFGAIFGAEHTYLTFFGITGVGFGLIFLTSMVGRTYCGFFCPQTVFIEGVYRRIEAWIEGKATERRKLDQRPWDAHKLLRRGGKWAAYLVVSLALAHVVLGYFVPVREMARLVLDKPSAHPEAFAWVMGVTALLAFDFGWFREQFCTILCPYGRLQGSLIDEDTIAVGYDTRRGEPRGKPSDPAAADCVDCFRCVEVCPTGIDIRNGGAQLECISCLACVDACDDVMLSLDRAPGLVRQDSAKGFAGAPRRVVRPQLFIDAGLGVLGLAALTFSLRQVVPFDLKLLRGKGVPYTLHGDDVENVLRVRLASSGALQVKLTATAPGATSVLLPISDVALQADKASEVPLLLRGPRGAFSGKAKVTVTAKDEKGRAVSAEAVMLGPDLGAASSSAP
ncbi:MAG: cytochrome c oxidase accessory protein CcoG [Polyangiaceae bacterium]|nr:cytochrome c oxidase accessory protein CcoG [Polyangiaceae bacterium]